MGIAGDMANVTQSVHRDDTSGVGAAVLGNATMTAAGSERFAGTFASTLGSVAMAAAGDAVVAPSGASYADTFTRADGALGADWQSTQPTTPFVIIDNAAQESGGGWWYDWVLYLGGVMETEDVYVEAHAIGTAGHLWLFAHGDGTADNFVYGDWGCGGYIGIQSRVSNTDNYTSAGQPPPTPNPPADVEFVARVEIVGGDVSTYLDGVLVQTAAGAGHSGAFHWGFGGNQNTRVLSIAAGDL